MSDVDNLPTVLARVATQVGSVGKDQVNQHQKFNFRGIDAVVNAAAGPLHAAGVVVMPELVSLEHGIEEVGARKSRMNVVRVIVTYRFYGPAGDSLAATVPGEAMDSGDKATSKAMSVAFRTALLQALTLPTDEPDPDADSYELSAVQEAPTETLKDVLAWLPDEFIATQDMDKLRAWMEEGTGREPTLVATLHERHAKWSAEVGA
jgi:hypothetical protein